MEEGAITQIDRWRQRKKRAKLILKERKIKIKARKQN